MYKVTRRHRRSITANGVETKIVRPVKTGARAPAAARCKPYARAAALTILILTAALTVSACTAPRAWEFNEQQTAHEKTQSSELNDAGMSIGDAAILLLESDYAAFSDAPSDSDKDNENASSDENDNNGYTAESGAEIYTSDISIPGQGTKPVPENEAALEIAGKYVSKQYLELRTALYATASSEKDPVKAAETLIKKQVIQWKFAEKNELLPTDEDVMSYTDSMRADTESDIESRETMLLVVQNMGFNESEYFRVFQPRYEVPFLLVEENISDYCSKNNIDMPDTEKAKVKVKDEKYIKELRKKYQKDK